MRSCNLMLHNVYATLVQLRYLGAGRRRATTKAATAVRALSDPISPLRDLRSSVLIPFKSVIDLTVKSLMVWHGSVPANSRLRRLYEEKYGELPVDILNKKLITWVISALNS